MTAFKEWQVVCDALASGKQSIIFRKGGIHEGRKGFAFKEENFFLFPTRFHAQSEQVKVEHPQPLPEWQEGDPMTITHFAQAEWAETLNDWAAVSALADHHIWTEDCLQARYDWTGKGMSEGSIHLAFLRVYQLAEPLSFPYEKSLGGCRSWVELPLADDVEIELIPVLDDAEHLRRGDEIRSRLSVGAAS